MRLRAIAVLVTDALVLAQFFMVLARSMVTFLLAVTLFNNAPLWVLGLAMAMPALLQTAVGTGVSFLSDRVARHRLYALGIATLVPAAAIGLAGSASESAATITLPIAYFLASAGVAAAIAASTVLVPLRFRESSLSRVNSLLMALAMAALTVGPLLAAAARDLASESGAYIVVIAIACAGTALATRTKQDARARPLETGSVREGAITRGALETLLRSRPLLLITLALSVTWLGIGGVNAIEVPFLIHNLGGGALGYAVILSWGSVWGFAFSSLYAAVGDHVSSTTAYMLGTIGLAVGWTGFALSPSLPFAAAAVLFTGIAGVLMNIGSSSLLQRMAKDEARIGGVLGLAFGAFHITGAASLAIFAALADTALTVRMSLLVEGIVAFAAVPLAVFAVLAVRDWQDSKPRKGAVAQSRRDLAPAAEER